MVCTTLMTRADLVKRQSLSKVAIVKLVLQSGYHYRLVTKVAKVPCLKKQIIVGLSGTVIQERLLTIVNILVLSRIVPIKLSIVCSGSM